MLLIGGSVRAAAEDAATAGYRIVAVDRFGDYDLRAIGATWIPLRQGDEWLAAAKCHAGPIVPTGGFLWPAGPLDEQLRQRVAYPPPDRLAASREPDTLQAIARQAGIRFPETRPVTPRAISSLPDPAAWLVKPVAGTGGAGIRSLADGPRRGQAGSPGNDHYLQRRLLGRTIGVSYFSRDGSSRSHTRRLGIYAGLTHRRNPQHRWLYGGSIGPFDTDWPDRDAAHGPLADLGQAVAEAFGLVGLFNIDLIRQPDDSLWLLEINPRYSASMELLVQEPNSRSRSLIDAHLAAHQERAGTIDIVEAERRIGWLSGDTPLVPAGHIACKRIVYARRTLTIPSDPLDWRRRAGLWPVDSAPQSPLAVDGRFQITLHDLPAPTLSIVSPADHDVGPPTGPTEVIEAGMPLLTIIVRGSGHIRDCLRIARQIESRIAG